ncbi:MAG: hypothetical protein FJ304_15355 [Planctomycetes bacterium]|nr:hypothetical protein [Planctomycetota bacterium]
MKLISAAVLALLVDLGAARADDTPKLIGKWEVTKSGGETPVGSTVEFTKDGKMTALVPLDGKATKLTGTYKLDGKKLSVKLALNEQKIEHDFTVKFKGETELELEYPDKTADTLKKK